MLASNGVEHSIELFIKWGHQGNRDQKRGLDVPATMQTKKSLHCRSTIFAGTPKPRFRSHDPPWPRRFGIVHGTATGSGESFLLHRSFLSRLALKVLGILRHLWPIGAAELYHTHVSCFCCWISRRGNWSQPTRRRLFNYIKAKLFCCCYVFCLYAKSGPSIVHPCLYSSQQGNARVSLKRKGLGE